MKEQITYDIFDKVDLRIGTVISVKKNEKARKPSLIAEVDLEKKSELNNLLLKLHITIMKKTYLENK